MRVMETMYNDLNMLKIGDKFSYHRWGDNTTTSSDVHCYLTIESFWDINNHKELSVNGVVLTRKIYENICIKAKEDGNETRRVIDCDIYKVWG